MWLLIMDCNPEKSCWIIGWLEFIIDVSIFFNTKSEYKESETILMGWGCRQITWIKAYNSFYWTEWNLL